MPQLRVILLGVAGITVVISGSVIVEIATRAWALDIDRYLRAAQDLAAGRFGQDRGYLYSPFAALLTIPLLALPHAVAVWGWLIARLGVIAWGVRHETRDLRPVDALLVAICVVAFLPTGYDLLLGNVTVFVVAGVALVAWRRDAFTTGIVLGLVLATAPKPQLIPVLLWMLIYRPRALGGAVVTAGIATLATVALLGIGPYLSWVDVLRAPDYLNSPMNGNLTPDALLPALAWPIKVVVVVGLLFALRKGETNGLVAALTAGLLIAPYTMAYGAMALLLGLRPLAAVAPQLAVGLAAIGSIAVFVELPLYALAWLFAACGLEFAPMSAASNTPGARPGATDDPQASSSPPMTVAPTG